MLDRIKFPFTETATGLLYINGGERRIRKDEILSYTNGYFPDYLAKLIEVLKNENQITINAVAYTHEKDHVILIMSCAVNIFSLETVDYETTFAINNVETKKQTHSYKLSDLVEFLSNDILETYSKSNNHQLDFLCLTDFMYSLLTKRFLIKK